MAISPPSDIVLDVAKAVDKTDLEAARARLASASATRSASTFSLSGTAAVERPISRADTPPGEDRARASHVKFDAMVLRNFMEAMLPAEASTVYGKGLAGDMWKSMMAEQIANVMAERGGVGIATRVLGDYYKEGDRKVAVVGVDGGPQKQALDARNMLSRAMIQEFERAVMAGHDGGADGADRT